MASLQPLHEATVLPEEIDHLGHMNVRFYLEKALRGSRARLAEIGLTQDVCQDLGATLELRDVFTRHYREQMEGAELVVMGGLLGARADSLRLYLELLNPAREERAATFVHELKLRNLETREPLPLPEIVAQRASEALVEMPEHGGPRTLDLDRTPGELKLVMGRERGLERRKVRTIQADECDEQGFFVASQYQDLVWGGEPINERTGFWPLYETEDGIKFGWATLESRGILRKLPREGDRVQSFGAEVEIANKTSVRHQWVLDVERDEVLCMTSSVNLAFDIGARRAIEIPEKIRRALESEFNPDLR